jgi:hypothetical protein
MRYELINRVGLLRACGLQVVGRQDTDLCGCRLDGFLGQACCCSCCRSLSCTATCAWQCLQVVGMDWRPAAAAAASAFIHSNRCAETCAGGSQVVTVPTPLSILSHQHAESMALQSDAGKVPVYTSY